MTDTTDTKNLPNYVRDEAKCAAIDLQLIHDLLSGSRRMWDKAREGTGGVPYIFKWAKEHEDTYKIRSKCETLFEGIGRTLSACTGMLFAKPPQVTWNQSETAMQEIWANIDAAGTAGPVLVKRFAEGSLRDGIGAILVDHPKPPEPQTTPLGTVTADIAHAMGLRPTWAIYSRGQVINWRTAVINNKKALSLVVFAESGEVEDGAYGIRIAERYRVVRLILTPIGYQATWTLWELAAGAKGEKAEEFTRAGGGVFTNKDGKVATFLPVSIAYTGRTDAAMCATIPLLGVAFANLSHWQQSTDLRFYRMVAAYPQPVVKGDLAKDATTGQEKPLGAGPLVYIHVSEGGDYSWAEIEGKSMAQLESGITEKLRQMAALGLAFLHSETRAAETAAAKRIDSVAQNATLSTAGQGIEDAVNLALEHTAWYLGIEKAGAPVLTINRDFELAALDAQMLTAYVTLVTAGFPKRIVLGAMQDTGFVPPDENLEALEAEWEQHLIAAEQAKQDQLAAEAEAALAKQGEKKPIPLAA